MPREFSLIDMQKHREMNKAFSAFRPVADRRG